MVTPTEPEAHGDEAPSTPAHPADAGPAGASAPPTTADDAPATTADGAPATTADGAPETATRPDRPRLRRRHVAAGVVLLLLLGFVVGASVVHLPYFVFKPGSVRDAEPLITVSGTEVFPSKGSIAYTTVSLRQATLFDLVQGWLDDDIDILDRDVVLGGRDVNENRQVNLQMMSDSKQVATQVALERLGYPVDVSVGQLVVDVVDGGPAEGLLSPGDVIAAIDGESFDDGEDLSRILAHDPPGTDIVLTIENVPQAGGTAGGGRDVDITLGAAPDDPQRGYIGVLLNPQPVVLDYDFPFTVEIDTGDVGGPSAGLAFTLALIDDLTPGDLTGGSRVAVTGTIAGDGTVGPVGGTGQKAAAVRAAGFDLFLVPSADYQDAVDHAGDHLRVVAVDTVDEALTVLGEHGGNVEDLPDVGEAAAAPLAG